MKNFETPPVDNNPQKNEESLNKVEADIIDVAESRRRLEAALKSIKAAFLQSKPAEDRGAEATDTTIGRIEPTMNALPPPETTASLVAETPMAPTPLERGETTKAPAHEENVVITNPFAIGYVAPDLKQEGNGIEATVSSETVVSDKEKTPKILTDAEQAVLKKEPKEARKDGEKLTPKNIENSFKIGKPIEVRVQRSSGEIEEGWIVVGSNDKDAVVTKTSEGGETLRKVIPLEELKELNKEYGQSKPLDQSEVPSREPQEGGSVPDNEKTPKILTDVEQFAKNLEAAEAKLAEAIKEKESIDAFALKEEVGLMERAEKGGTWVLDKVRKMDERWKKVSLKNKLAISGVLLLSGLGAVAIGSSAAIAGVGLASVALRGLGMISLFGTFDRMLASAHGKISAEPRSNRAISIEAGTALALAVAIGLLMPKILQDFIGDVLPSTPAGPMNAAPSAAEVFSSEHTSSQTAGPLETPTESTLKTPPGAAHEPGQPTITPEKLAELTTVKAGQGIWHPISAQVEAANPDWTKAQINKETLRLLVENKIINPDGSELRVSKAGMQVFLNPDGSITFDKAGTYTYTPVVSSEVLGGHTLGENVRLDGNHSGTLPEGSGAGETASETLSNLGDSAPHFNANSSEVPKFTTDSPAVVSVVNYEMKNFINKIPGLGSKGLPWLGWFAEKGVDSLNWKYLATVPVETLLAATPVAFPVDGGQTFGIDNYSATTELQKTLRDLIKNSNIPFNSGEQVQGYIKRTIESVLLKKMNN